MSEPIRILNLFTIMNRGGAETMVMNYYRNIDRTKVQFDFMVHRQERGAYDDEIESLGGRIYRMPCISFGTLVEYKNKLKEFFNTHKDYRILHSHMSELGYFAFKEAIKYGIPVRICHAHNAPSFLAETFTEKLKRIPREILARGIRKLLTDKFTCSKIAGEWLFGKNNIEDMIFMPNAVDAGKFKFNNDVMGSVRKQFGWEGKTIIGHVGRFNPQKNHKFLLDIFEHYHRINANSILVLVGSGFLQDEIKTIVKNKRLNDSVYFLGIRTDMEYIYQSFDTFLFPSLYEGLPVSLIEAQSAGIPCVVSDAISSQCKITSSYFQLSLSAPLDTWSKVLSEAIKQEKYNTYSLIKNAGFDISANAEWLCDFYITKHYSKS